MGLGGNPRAIASLSPGETVLGLGIGGGIDCFLAAKEVGEAGAVIGIDMTPDMVSKARENAERTGHNNVELRLGEIENLPVADGIVIGDALNRPYVRVVVAIDDTATVVAPRSAFGCRFAFTQTDHRTQRVRRIVCSAVREARTDKHVRAHQLQFGGPPASCRRWNHRTPEHRSRSVGCHPACELDMFRSC